MANITKYYTNEMFCWVFLHLRLYEPPSKPAFSLKTALYRSKTFLLAYSDVI